ncbi:hypothetical protein GCM10010345_90320 [Streptomyces canarius]|uniref:Uncharacterized protein n=1 Tax=Streptomyces canarius TaxID=285453 RepID=A0ABQ3DBS0_9ACTN|nr:hypothetical protein GCM10010345_90320 [Streptomyces canarius]
MPTADRRRQWGRTGFGAICIQRAKSRASTRVARSHATPQPARNRHQRSRSIPYERTVDGGRPHAWSAAKNASTGSTAAPSASSSTYGRPGSAVSTNRPESGSTKPTRSRAALSASNMPGKLAETPSDLRIRRI